MATSFIISAISRQIICMNITRFRPPIDRWWFPECDHVVKLTEYSWKKLESLCLGRIVFLVFSRLYCSVTISGFCPADKQSPPLYGVIFSVSLSSRDLSTANPIPFHCVPRTTESYTFEMKMPQGGSLTAVDLTESPLICCEISSMVVYLYK